QPVPIERRSMASNYRVALFSITASQPGIAPETVRLLPPTTDGTPICTQRFLIKVLIDTYSGVSISRFRQQGAGFSAICPAEEEVGASLWRKPSGGQIAENPAVTAAALFIRHRADAGDGDAGDTGPLQQGQVL